MTLVHSILISMRPKQWVKNGFLFVALVFSKNMFSGKLMLIDVAAFAMFCLASGGIYVLNDLIDVEKDRRHPIKRGRPLASGKLMVPAAKIIVAVALGVSIGTSFLVNQSFALVVIGYLSIQIVYSIYFKEVVIIDVFSIASGFFLRVIAGAEAIQVPVSSWLLICTIFVSLFLGLGKRRHELVLLGEEAKSHRGTLNEYNELLLDQMISVAAAGVVVSYSLYTLAPDTIRRFSTEKLWYTIPIVLYGVFRYLYLIYRKGEGGSPEMLFLVDRQLQITIMVYAILVGVIIYL